MESLPLCNSLSRSLPIRMEKYKVVVFSIVLVTLGFLFCLTVLELVSKHIQGISGTDLSSNLELLARLDLLESELNSLKRNANDQEIQISKIGNATLTKISYLEVNISKHYEHITSRSAKVETAMSSIEKDFHILRSEYLNSSSNFEETLTTEISSCHKSVNAMNSSLNILDNLVNVNVKNHLEFLHFMSSVETRLGNTTVKIGKLETRLGDYGRKVEKVVTCEGHKAVIECNDTDTTIKIKYANYGRTEPGSVVCPHAHTLSTNCLSIGATEKMAQSCDGKSKCELMATNSVFGDECPTTYKYLMVNYFCV